MTTNTTPPPLPTPSKNPALTVDRSKLPIPIKFICDKCDEVIRSLTGAQKHILDNLSHRLTAEKDI